MRSKFFNQYEALRRLGSGGSGIAYYAYDTKLMRPVVLKMIHRGAASTEQMRETILREARLASAIEHPNVCSIYEVNEFAGRPFIVMQYVPGRPLDSLIEAGPLSLPLALSIGLQISDGLAAAHGLGILHRDLKPANIMITEGGLVKILDFGLAKRTTAEELSATTAPRRRSSRKTSSSVPRGTIAYMAPEQFVTGRSSEQTDIFSLGIILYEMVTGTHPFVQSEMEQSQVARAIQYFDPTGPREKRPELSVEFEGIILKALEKQPSNRFSSAIEVREALRTLMKAMHLEESIVAANVTAIAPALEEPGQRTSLLSMLAERFMRKSSEGTPENSIIVFPFANIGADDVPSFYGYALAEAIATRLARLPTLAVRPSSSLVTAQHLPRDPVEAGRRLSVKYVLTGTFLRSESDFILNWQVLEVASSAVRSGGTISVASLDLVAVQNEISDEIFASLHGTGHLQFAAQGTNPASSNADISEDYLQARALLSNFIFRSSQREDLQQARGRFRAVLARNPQYAPAHSGLGIALLQYVQKGFGGLSHLIEAQKCFERALGLDPEMVEANLYRVYIFLWRGEKESARQGVYHLLEAASNDFAVHQVAGVVLRLDGLYERAMSELSVALRLNPAAAAVVYNERARLYHYQGQLELATEEIDKGLTLEPKHPLLRTTLGYLYFRRTDIEKAIATLESVLEDNTQLRIAYPTLAMCYLAAGQREQAGALITDEILAASDADAEMAYRLATYFAIDGDAREALHWLRKAIYLGDENYPWMATNPAWIKLRDNADFQKILSDLKKSYRLNTKRWKQLLSERAAPAAQVPGH